MENKRSHRHTGVRGIDLFAYTSGMNAWNPAFKVCLAVGTIILCLALDRPAVSLAVVLSMGWLSVRRGGVPMGGYLSLLRVPLAFLLLSGLAVACTVGKTPVGDWNLSLHWFYISVTADSLRFALALTAKAFGAVSALYLLALSTPAGELAGVLRRAHLPELLVELMYLIYRFVFILLDTHGRMRDAAQSRLGYRDFRTSCRSFGWTAGNLLVLAIKKSSVYYDAMESRCYNGSLRFLETEKPAHGGQWVGAAAFWAALCALRLLTG